MRSRPIRLGITVATLLAIASFSPASTSQSPPSTVFPAEPPTATPTPALNDETETPNRLTIMVSVRDPQDLKVRQDQPLQAGDLVADRTVERSRLLSQRAQLQLTLTRLKSATITPPRPPAPVPAIAPLPPASYLEQEAAIDQANAAVEIAAAAIATKQQELEQLRQLPNLNPIVLEHEQAKLSALEREYDAALQNRQLSIARLDTARTVEAQQRYQHSIDRAERIESHNQAALAYQQQKASYEQQLRDRDYQATQVQLKLDELNSAIDTLAVIRAPYAGTVRRVRWLGQAADGSLSAEVTLMLDRLTNDRPRPIRPRPSAVDRPSPAATDRTALPGVEPRMSQPTD